MSKIIFAAYILATSLALITLKLSTVSGSPILFSGDKILLNINQYTVIGILLYGFSFLLYIYLISKFSLGYIIPITTALVYVLVFIASFVIFKEVFTATKIIGIALILLGFILLNLNRNGSDESIMKSQ